MSGLLYLQLMVQYLPSMQFSRPVFVQERAMAHAVHIQSQQQYIKALHVLDRLKGTWQGVGPASAPVLLVTDEQYRALIEAGVVPSNDKEVNVRGKKATGKKTQS
jgi:hypothetical protein